MEEPHNLGKKWYKRGWKAIIIEPMRSGKKEKGGNYCHSVFLIMLVIGGLFIAKNLFNLGFMEEEGNNKDQNNDTNIFANFWQEFSDSKLYFILFPILYNQTTGNISTKLHQEIMKPFTFGYSTPKDTKILPSLHGTTSDSNISFYLEKHISEGTERTRHVMKQMSTENLMMRKMSKKNFKKNNSSSSFKTYIDLYGKSVAPSLHKTDDSLHSDYSLIFSTEGTISTTNNESKTKKLPQPYQNKLDKMSKSTTTKKAEQFILTEDYINFDLEKLQPRFLQNKGTTTKKAEQFILTEDYINFDMEKLQPRFLQNKGTTTKKAEQFILTGDYINLDMEKLQPRFLQNKGTTSKKAEQFILTEDYINFDMEKLQPRFLLNTDIEYKISNDLLLKQPTSLQDYFDGTEASESISIIQGTIESGGSAKGVVGSERTSFMTKKESTTEYQRESYQDNLDEINSKETISGIEKTVESDGPVTASNEKSVTGSHQEQTDDPYFFVYSSSFNNEITEGTMMMKNQFLQTKISEPSQYNLYETNSKNNEFTSSTDSISLEKENITSYNSLPLIHGMREIIASTMKPISSNEILLVSTNSEHLDERNERKTTPIHKKYSNYGEPTPADSEMSIMFSLQAANDLNFSGYWQEHDNITKDKRKYMIEWISTEYFTKPDKFPLNYTNQPSVLTSSQTESVSYSTTESYIPAEDDSGFTRRQKKEYDGFTKSVPLDEVKESSNDEVISETTILNNTSNLSTGFSLNYHRFISSTEENLKASTEVSFYIDLIKATTIPLHVMKNDSWINGPGWNYNEINIDISHYDLLISHNATKLWGEISLTMQVYVAMDQVDLQFDGEEAFSPEIFKMIKASTEEHSTVNVKVMTHDIKRGRIIIKLLDTMTPGNNYTVKMNFISPLNQFERGANLKTYVSREVDFNVDKERWVIGSYLYPNYGKNIFPCIEAPNRRSAFHLRINHDKREETVSNTIKITNPGFGPEDLLDDFATTPAILVSSFMFHIMQDYDFVTFNRTRTPTLIIWYPPYIKYSINSLANISLAVLDFFYKYFQYKIPTQQISIIVCEDLYSDPPASFGSILISSKFLYEQIDGKYKNTENLYYYMAKQFCDLWMGNIVNFNSWNDDWIKEGFSKYMAHLATNEIYADYDISSFIFGKQNGVFQLHRFSCLMNNNNLYYINDRTSYKAAFLFHMVHNVLKENAFKEGIQYFFNKWALRNTDPDNLWNSFDTVQGNINITQFIKSWNNNNCPIINVGLENNNIIIEQVPNPTSPTEVGSWWIPINYVTEQDLYFDYSITHWIKEERTVKINVYLDKSWIIVNPEYSALIRTNYTQDLWKLLITGLIKEHKQFPSLVRAQLLDEAFTLAADGLLDYSLPMAMALYLVYEEEYAPWVVALKHFSFMAEFLIDYPEWQLLQEYIAHIMKNISLKLGMEKKNERAIDGQLRKLLVSWSCLNELPNGCAMWASNKFEKWRNSVTFSSKNSIPVELRSIVYCMGAKTGEGATKFLYSFSKMSMVAPDEELRLLRAVSCSNANSTFLDILEDVFSINNPAFSLLRLREFWESLWQSHKNSLISFQYVMYYWKNIYERFHGNHEILNVIIEGATHYLRTNNHVKEVLKLRDQVPKNEYSLLNTFDCVINQIDYNINWVTRNLDQLRKWLNYYHIRLAM